MSDWKHCDVIVYDGHSDKRAIAIVFLDGDRAPDYYVLSPQKAVEVSKMLLAAAGECIGEDAASEAYAAFQAEAQIGPYT